MPENVLLFFAPLALDYFESLRLRKLIIDSKQRFEVVFYFLKNFVGDIECCKGAFFSFYASPYALDSELPSLSRIHGGLFKEPIFSDLFLFTIFLLEKLGKPSKNQNSFQLIVENLNTKLVQSNLGVQELGMLGLPLYLDFK